VAVEAGRSKNGEKGMRKKIGHGQKAKSRWKCPRVEAGGGALEAGRKAKVTCKGAVEAKREEVVAGRGSIEAGSVDRRALSGRRLAERQQEEEQLRPEEKQK
jgi:hypothetical protein